jgi:hypothetical protein
VIRIAITPSLKASIRPVDMLAQVSAADRRHRVAD